MIVKTIVGGTQCSRSVCASSENLWYQWAQQCATSVCSSIKIPCFTIVHSDRVSQWPLEGESQFFPASGSAFDDGFMTSSDKRIELDYWELISWKFREFRLCHWPSYPILDESWSQPFMNHFNLNNQSHTWTVADFNDRRSMLRSESTCSSYSMISPLVNCQTRPWLVSKIDNRSTSIN